MFRENGAKGRNMQRRALNLLQECQWRTFNVSDLTPSHRWVITDQIGRFSQSHSPQITLSFPMWVSLQTPSRTVESMDWSPSHNKATLRSLGTVNHHLAQRKKQHEDPSPDSEAQGSYPLIHQGKPQYACSESWVVHHLSPRGSSVEKSPIPLQKPCSTARIMRWDEPSYI